ncbi:MAG: cytochrome c oxidase subunit 3 family protein [Leptospiraceae bacterium]|nr:cytochrome c oxidase subunit 3 family protein [Leptospiraceae bacterium]
MSTVKTESHFHHAHHFDSAEHQYSSAKQGIWLFMVTEVLMFGGLFVAYLIYKSLYAPVFHVGSSYLDVKMGTINTFILITSSFTMALGIYFNQKNERKKAVISLALTILCALGFMTVKYFEYSHKIHLGLVPGKYFDNPEFVQKVVDFATNMQAASSSNQEIDIAGLKKFAPLYFGFYFVMTGLHGFHVIIGACLILWVMLRTAKGHFGPEYYTPVEGVGLFWHIVDLIWIYLFPLLYLVG